jgi:hypothetical protein
MPALLPVCTQAGVSTAGVGGGAGGGSVAFDVAVDAGGGVGILGVAVATGDGVLASGEAATATGDGVLASGEAATATDWLAGAGLSPVPKRIANARTAPPRTITIRASRTAIARVMGTPPR